MSRRPKPWFRKSHCAWFVTINGRQHNLGLHKKAAETQFKALMQAPRDAAIADTSVAYVFDQFLDWTKKHRAPRTFEFYRQRLQWFLNHLPSGMACQRLKPFHV
jgi:integrase/recombinase XerD